MHARARGAYARATAHQVQAYLEQDLVNDGIHRVTLEGCPCLRPEHNAGLRENQHLVEHVAPKLLR